MYVISKITILQTWDFGNKKMGICEKTANQVKDEYSSFDSKLGE